MSGDDEKTKSRGTSKLCQLFCCWTRDPDKIPLRPGSPQPAYGAVQALDTGEGGAEGQEGTGQGKDQTPRRQKSVRFSDQGPGASAAGKQRSPDSPQEVSPPSQPQGGDKDQPSDSKEPGTQASSSQPQGGDSDQLSDSMEPQTSEETSNMPSESTVKGELSKPAESAHVSTCGTSPAAMETGGEDEKGLGGIDAGCTKSDYTVKADKDVTVMTDKDKDVTEKTGKNKDVTGKTGKDKDEAGGDETVKGDAGKDRNDAEGRAEDSNKEEIVDRGAGKERDDMEGRGGADGAEDSGKVESLESDAGKVKTDNAGSDSEKDVASRGSGKDMAEANIPDSSAPSESQRQAEAEPSLTEGTCPPLSSSCPDVFADCMDRKSGTPPEASELEESADTLKASDPESYSETL